MRAYFFGNMYLSHIQQGIQAAHVVHELFTKYNSTPLHDEVGAEVCFVVNERMAMLNDWATNHKTMILLNAGYGENIKNLCRFFSKPGNEFPWAYFEESAEALDGAITSVGILLPPLVYETAAALRDPSKPHLKDKLIEDGRWRSEDGTVYDFNDNKWELDLVFELNNYGLAR